MGLLGLIAILALRSRILPCENRLYSSNSVCNLSKSLAKSVSLRSLTKSVCVSLHSLLHFFSFLLLI